MNRNDIISLLINSGYHATIENHLLVIRYTGNKSPLEAIRKILHDNGYHASFCLQQSHAVAEYVHADVNTDRRTAEAV